MRIVFSRLADADLDAIGLYGLTNWGEGEAQTYYVRLFEAFDRLAPSRFSAKRMMIFRRTRERCPSVNIAFCIASRMTCFTSCASCISERPVQ